MKIEQIKENNNMKILYRITEGGNNKKKPDFVYNKQNMFKHFIKIFKNNDIYVFADNVKDDFYNFLLSNYDSNKIFRISLGNCKSFIYTVDYAIKNFNNNDIIYFAEDDYIYKKDADKIIKEGLCIGDYSSGYDHPDKYINHSDGGPNPFIKNGGEETILMKTDNSHWKLTNSCCMTFATTVKILKKDYDIFIRNCNGLFPNDFNIFCELKKYNNRKLVSCIPAVSTHGESEWLSPFINWEYEFNKSIS